MRGLVTAKGCRGHGIIPHLITQKAIHQQAKQTSTLHLSTWRGPKTAQSHFRISQDAMCWWQGAQKSCDMAAQLTPSSHGLPLAAKIFSTAVGSKPFAPRPYLNWSCPSCKLVQKHLSWAPDMSAASFFLWLFLGYSCIVQPTSRVHHGWSLKLSTKTYVPKRIWIERFQLSSHLSLFKHAESQRSF